jgi:hypothetical protein
LILGHCQFGVAALSFARTGSRFGILRYARLIFNLSLLRVVIRCRRRRLRMV